MKKIFVFTITEEVIENNSLDGVKTENLDKIIKLFLGSEESGLPGEIQRYQINNNNNSEHHLAAFRDKHISKVTNEEDLKKDVRLLANDLLKAELVMDNGEFRRNKLITPGILVVKYSINKLILLKLEETNGIDMNSFEIKNTLVFDRKYYKAAIIYADVVNIIDKNKKVANYWSDKFLNVTKIKDDKVNTKYFIESLDKDTIINEAVKNPKIRNELNTLIKDLSLSCLRFDSEEWLHEINYKILENHNFIDQYTLEKLFNMETINILDNDFELDKKAIKKALSTRLKINDSIIIDVLNLEGAIDKKSISIDGDDIKIRISKENRDRIKNLF